MEPHPGGKWAYAVEVVGDYAYATTSNNALVIIGIDTPTAPGKLDEMTSSGDLQVQHRAVNDTYAYLTEDQS